MLESGILTPLLDSDAETDGTPWEKRGDLGLLNGIFLTFKKALFQPGVLFKARSYPEGLKEPLAFGLLIGGFGDMLAFFWPVLLFSLGILPFGDSVFRHLNGVWIFLTLMVGIPLAVVLKMIFYSGILHLMLLIVRGGKKGYKSTFRVVAYSQAALVHGISYPLWAVGSQPYGNWSFRLSGFMKSITYLLYQGHCGVLTAGFHFSCVDHHRHGSPAGASLLK